MSNSLLNRYQSIRKQTVALTEGLNPEDTVIQPVTYVSPPKWHMAHTTWFFENFILKKYVSEYKVFHSQYDFLFNSYYESQGSREKRNWRGFHSRPVFSEVLEYRNVIDEQVHNLIQEKSKDAEFVELIELGLQHEQQHQELLLTDLKFIWHYSPLHPIFRTSKAAANTQKAEQNWLKVDEGVYDIGYPGDKFHFDNETPRHKTYIHKFQIAQYPVTVGEYLEFINDGGYSQWKYWLHEGWQWVQENNITSPLYWKKVNGDWYIYTLNGLQKLESNQILAHVNFYEADAYARWRGLRLPTEQEWEVTAVLYGKYDTETNFLENGIYHTNNVNKSHYAFLGEVWEWTNSAYLPYPGYKPWKGGIGEYNGKFMINQMVLRGGSCVTSQKHIRISYRNFFHPWLQWQFSGIRLAKDF